MKHTLLIITALMLVVGCSSPEPINIDELIKRDGIWYTKDTNIPYSGKAFSLHENGQKEGEGTFKDGKPDGLFTEWYENGQKREKLTWKDGKANGKRTSWYSNGQKREKGTIKDGKYDGKWTAWHKNGQKSSEETWKNGIKHGLWTSYHENGQKYSKYTYKDGSKDGLYTRWYENGQKGEEGTYKDGSKDGLWSYWYGNGQKILEVTFKDGVENGLYTEWYENGQKRYEGNIKGEEGLYTEWYENGQKKSEEKNVKIFPNYPLIQLGGFPFISTSFPVLGSGFEKLWKDRLYTEWYENGQKKEDWDINDGDGKVTYWYDNGQKERVETYKDGRIFKTWYHENRQKYREGTYANFSTPKIEILNGYGEPGLATKFSEFLRTEGVYVVRSENADHFGYEKTILIQRSGNVEGMKHVAAVLGFSVDNPPQVITSLDPNLDVDLTLIIGKDYQSISPIQSYLKN